MQLIALIIFQLGGTGRRVKVVSSSQTRPLTSALMSSARSAKSARRKSAKSASGRRKIILPKQRTKRNQGGRKTTRTRTRRSESFPKLWSAALRMIPTKAYLEMALIFIFKSVQLYCNKAINGNKGRKNGCFCMIKLFKEIEIKNIVQCNILGTLKKVLSFAEKNI